MQISKNELISIIDDATTAFAELILTHCRQQVDLHESTFGQTQDDAAKARLATLKKDVERAKERLAQSRDRENRNKTLRRLKQQQDKASAEKAVQNEQKRHSGTTTRLTDGAGKLVGTRVRAGKNRTYYYNATNKLVAIEANGQTFDGSSGRFAGRGKIGLILLGKSLRK